MPDIIALSLRMGRLELAKTHTMSDDTTTSLGILPDSASITPRVLQGLFNKLDLTGNCVKVSFIELYNEEFPDFIAADAAAKLTIYVNTSWKEYATTIVQGMEEKHIKNADV